MYATTPRLSIFQYFSISIEKVQQRSEILLCLPFVLVTTLRTGRVDTGRWPVMEPVPRNSTQETEVALVNSLPERFRMQLHEDDGDSPG